MLSPTLRALENKSIYIIREALALYHKICILWSVGKDSSVLLWLIKKACSQNIPIPVVHIDSSFKIPEMITFRDTFSKNNAF